MNTKTNPFLNPGNIESPKFIDLYYAVRVIAFDEKPLDSNYSKLVYEGRNNYQQYINEPCPTEDSYLEWQSPEDENSFNLACNALLLWLMQGGVKAWGNGFEREEVENNPDPAFKSLGRQEIPKDFWDLFVNVSWYGGRADNHLGNTIKYYSFIEISVPSLVGAIQKNLGKKTQNKGRPTKYNWEGLFIEIIRRANHPDGLPATLAELEKEMAEWCQNNWPEEPGESTLRDKISPIYQLIDKASK